MNNIETLRTVLFEELENVRTGDCDSARVKDVLSVADKILDTARLEMEYIATIAETNIGLDFMSEPLQLEYEDNDND